MKTNASEEVPALPDISVTEEKSTEEKSTDKPVSVPNAKVRPAAAPLAPAPDDTYVYKDYAQIPLESLDTTTCHKKLPPACLQAQKLPAKMAVILVDSDLMHAVNWLPHGRSWKICNREIFTEIALPRYFGHKNYASFVRIVNAWGFRRVTSGLDRDSYYHELFLRGKPELHQRMKRLPTSHKKTPISKEDKAPDFYEISKISPLPEVTTYPTPAPVVYNSSVHPGSGYFLSASAATSDAAASVEAAAVAQGENAESKDQKEDDTISVLEQNMRLSNELLKRQLLELQQRENGVPGYPRNAAEAEMRMNHQLMQLQRERFQQVQQGQNELDQQKDIALKTVNDTQPIANDDDTKEEESKAPDANEGDKKEGTKGKIKRYK